MKEKLQILSERIEKTKNVIQTEEATKNAFIMPFLQILGYDVFNPLEVIPEFTADLGNKKGEKVDYAICINNQPAILLECKDCNNDLNVQNESQLLRYFHTTKAKIGILTNGITWKFYTDLLESNKMDVKPFLEINLLEYEKINYTELEKFSKENFDAENIKKNAELLKYAKSIKDILNNEFSNPSDDFLRVVFKQMETKAALFNDRQKEIIKPLVKQVIDNIISNKVKSSLDNALKTTEVLEVTGDLSGIVTTEEEIEAHNIIKAIVAEIIEPERVVMKDAKSYCAILLDNNNRRPIVRFYFGNKKYVSTFENGTENKQEIENIRCLYAFREVLLKTIQGYLD